MENNMIHEDDRFHIPKEYLNMSASELEKIANEELKKMKEENCQTKKKNKLLNSPVVINW